MNNNQRFDEHIKTNLSGIERDVPAHIWDNILAERNKRKPIPFWAVLLSSKNVLTFFALLFSGIVITWVVNKNGHTTVAGSDNTIVARNGVNPNTPGTTSPADNNTTSTAAPAETTTAANALPAAPITPSKTASVSKPVKDKNSRAGFKAPATFAHSAIANRRTRVKITAGIPGYEVVVKPAASTTPNEAIEEAGAGDDEPLVPATGTLYNRLLAGVGKLQGRQKIIPNIANRKTPNLYVPKCPVEKDASGNKKYIELYAAVDYGIQSLKDTGSSAYLQKRKESTKFAWAYSAGARYTKVFNNSMSVRTGVNFSQITEKFTFAQGNLVQVTYIINANGDTTGSYTTTGTRYKTTYNKYRTIDIPLLIGYEMGNGRLHTNINAGPVVNIYSWQKGDMLDSSYQPVSITTGKSSSVYGFKTNAGIGFMGAVSVYYKLTENLHLMAEPYFRYNFLQMNRTELTIKQKYNTVGFKLGVRLDIP